MIVSTIVAIIYDWNIFFDRYLSFWRKNFCTIIWRINSIVNNHLFLLTNLLFYILDQLLYYNCYFISCRKHQEHHEVNPTIQNSTNSIPMSSETTSLRSELSLKRTQAASTDSTVDRPSWTIHVDTAKLPWLNSSLKKESTSTISTELATLPSWMPLPTTTSALWRFFASKKRR